ncbi:MAG: DNA polymerase I, partial [Patescibacteria group bacterium]
MGEKKTLILIDANALIHRAYHALPPLSTKKGEIVNAVYGFASVFLKILREFKPDYVLAAFDLPAPTFRHLEYKEYKAHRPKTPEDLSAQFSRVKEVLAVFGVPVLEKAGFEADDVIGTVAEKIKKEKSPVQTVIVTGDLDTLQLVGENTKVCALKKGVSETVIYDEKAVAERFGLKPERLVDFKGLKGDPSDNIPGVKGIGEKTASVLIQKFGNLENLYAALEKEPSEKLGISKNIFEKLIKEKEAAFFSKKLATIERNVPIEFNLSDCETEKYDKNKAVKLFEELGFFSLVKRLQFNGEGTSNAPETGVERAPKSVSGGKIEIIGQKKDFKKLKTLYAGVEKEGCLAIGISEPAGDLFAELKLIAAVSEAVVFEIPFSFLKGEKKLVEILEDEKIKKIGHNLKAILKILAKNGVELKGFCFDVMLAVYLLNPGERDYSLPKIIFREFGEAPSQEDSRAGVGGLFSLKNLLLKKIKEGGLEKVFFEIEMPLIPILATTEENGFKINSRMLNELSKEVGAEIAELEKKIFKEAGAEFNVNSPKQLSEILFQKLKIETKGLRKTAGGGAVSTQASELEKLAGRHKIIDLILKYRELAKLKTTYLDALPPLADKNGKIHITFEQTITATGRLSSRDPNLQNIPAGGDWAKKIRSAFLAQEGFVLAAFDYSQVELRIAAALSGDEKMIKAFAEGKDIHTLTAAEINNVPEEKVTPE